MYYGLSESNYYILFRGTCLASKNVCNCFLIDKIKINLYNEIINYINTMLCPIKVNSKTIELTVHTSC